MNQVKLLLTTTIIGLSIYGCGNNSQSNQTAETRAPQEHQHDEGSESIELNNGEKWLVNDEMKPYVSNGAALVDEYIESNKTDYQTLANQLKEQNALLVKSCTMKGKSHEELHKWLHPHMQMVTTLENANDEGEANGLISQLKESYSIYHHFFQ